LIFADRFPTNVGIKVGHAGAKKRKPTASFVVSAGSVSIPVYSRRSVAGRPCTEFTLSFYDAETVETEVFTVDELRRLLDSARPEILPALAIGGFAGLRSEEIIRLDWSEVKLAEGVIVVSAGWETGDPLR
jgi:hypothetical protein